MIQVGRECGNLFRPALIANSDSATAEFSSTVLEMSRGRKAEGSEQMPFGSKSGSLMAV